MSSDPFLGDFNKLAHRYAAEDTVVVTTVSKYGYTLWSVLKFVASYLRFRPNVILSDFGYIGFLPVRVLSKVLFPRVQMVFFLRGNWWIESAKQRNDSRNLPLGRRTCVTVNAPSALLVRLSEPGSKHRLTPSSVTYAGPVASHVYQSLWVGDFVADIGGSTYPFSTAHLGAVECETADIAVERRLEWRWREYWSELIKRVYLYGWDWSLEKFDVVTAVCGWLVDEVEARANRGAIVVPTPVEIPRELGAKALDLIHPSVLIMQNHQVELKSLALVRFASVVRRLPHVHFYVSRGLPENQSGPFYSSVMSALGDIPNVTFVDIDGSNKYDYLTSVDAYVLVSGLDCTPASVLEAGVARKPVVVSAVGGVPEMVLEGVTGWALPNADLDSWVSRIEELTSNPELAAKMGEAHRAHVEDKYGFEVFADSVRDSWSRKS